MHYVKKILYYWYYLTFVFKLKHEVIQVLTNFFLLRRFGNWFDRNISNFGNGRNFLVDRYLNVGSSGGLLLFDGSLVARY
jgi:hypothetical protein